MIFYLPLEHLDKRYTSALDKQLLREFARQNKKVIRIDGDVLASDIQTGAFLDSDSTNYYKFSQLMQVCKLFEDDTVQDGDTFFISDLWFPGLESIKYMAHFHGITVKVKGMFHAGSWTETDFVRGVEDWAQWIEKGWLKMCDAVFLGSQHIKHEMIEKNRVIDFLKLHVTGLPFSTVDLFDRVPRLPWAEKDNIVIFNGRLNDEKQPWIFDEIASHFPQVKFIKTMEHNLSKDKYLSLLSRAKIVFSSALQENFGYGVLEAAAYNCVLVLPNRLSYKEFYPSECLYESTKQAIEMIQAGLTRKDNPHSSVYIGEHEHNVERIVSLC